MSSHSIKVWMVRRSKLEFYIDILMMLASYGPRKETHLVSSIGVYREALEQHLDSLQWQNLIQKNLCKEGTLSAITKRGLRVLNVIVPIDEEMYGENLTAYISHCAIRGEIKPDSQRGR